MAAIIAKGAVPTVPVTGVMDIRQSPPSLSLEGLVQALSGSDACQLYCILGQLKSSEYSLEAYQDFSNIIQLLQKDTLSYHSRYVAAWELRRTIWRSLCITGKVLIDRSQQSLLRYSLINTCAATTALTRELYWIKALLFQEEDLQNPFHLYLRCLDTFDDTNEYTSTINFNNIEGPEAVLDSISSGLFFANSQKGIQVVMVDEMRPHQQENNAMRSHNRKRSIEEVEESKGDGNESEEPSTKRQKVMHTPSSSSDWVEAFRELSQSLPDSISLNIHLAVFYGNGWNGFPRDPERSFAYASKGFALCAKDLKIHAILASCYCEGVACVGQYKVLAVQHATYILTQNPNHLIANDILARCYFEGVGGVVRNRVLAVQHAVCILAQDAYHPTAHEILARCCFEGVGGVVLNKVLAVRHAVCVLAQDIHHLTAHEILASCCFEGVGGVAQDRVLAVQYAVRILAQDAYHLIAHDILARCYFEGVGGIMRNRVLAVQHAVCVLAQDTHHLIAHEILASCCFEGVGGVAQDRVLAVQHATQILAKKNTHLIALEILARCYFEGVDGVAQNIRLAVQHAANLIIQNPNCVVANKILGFVRNWSHRLKR